MASILWIGIAQIQSDPAQPLALNYGTAPYEKYFIRPLNAGSAEQKDEDITAKEKLLETLSWYSCCSGIEK